MPARLAALLGLLVCLYVAASCGGSTGAIQPEPPGSESTLAPTDELAELAALPALSELEGTSHTVSLAGPAWKELEPYPAFGGLIASAEVSELGDGGMRMIGGPIMSYAVYGVGGFDGDSFPTSLRIGTDSQLGEYYIAYSDFKKGRWGFVGPFTDDATAELPLPDGSTHREAYVSPGNNFYFAIVVTSGSGFDVSSLELGLRASQSGPRPPVILILPVGGEKVSLSWMHSPDHIKADFAGYRVERAPLLFGDYESLTPEPVNTDHFIDEGVVADTAYRYRIAAENLGGERSLWVPIDVQTQTGDLANPVCVVDGPQGVLFSPAFVGFDLSQSFDPEGQEITGYSIATTTTPETPLVGSQYSTVLEAGCHILRFAVQTADMRSGSTIIRVKVLPSWESEPQLVKSAPTPAPRRLKFPAIFHGQQTGLIAVSGYDLSQQALSIFHRPFDLADPPGMESLPAYWEIEELSQPMDLIDVTIMAAAMGNNYWIASFGEQENRWIEGPSRLGNSAVDLASDSNNGAIMYYVTAGGVSDDIRFCRSGNFNQTLLLKEDLGVVEALRACNDPLTGEIHVFYSNAAGIHWILTNVFGDILDEALVSATGSLLDCALNPQSGEPVALFYEVDRYRSSEFDGIGAFNASQLIDNAAVNHPGGSFAATDKLYAFFAVGAGQASIYQYDASAWSLRTAMPYSANSGFSTALADGQINPGSLMFMDSVAEGFGQVGYIMGDNEYTGQFQIPAAVGQGTRMHAAAFGSDVHLCWLNENVDTSTIYYSTDFAETWTSYVDAPIFALTVGTNNLGQFYYSGISGASAYLWYWDGAMPQSQLDFPLTDTAALPFINKRSYTQVMFWYSHDTGTGNSTIVEGYFDTGVPGTDYTVDTVAPPVEPVWEGAVSSGGLSEYYFVRADGFEPEDGVQLYYHGTSTDYDLLALQNVLTLDVLNAQSLTRTRTMASISYFGAYPLVPETAFITAYGDTHQPAMYTTDLLTGGESRKYSMDYEPFARDARRTVSADSAFGTGIVLLSDVEGRELIMEWSNFGDWEKLKVPAALKGGAMHEIVVGGDGRWHIFYRDRLTDQIWRLSTVDLVL